MTVSLQTTIGIVGLGSIGGSLGLDFRSLGFRVVGVSRNPDTCQKAIALGLVDEASTSLPSVAGAQIVFLCTPIAAIAKTALELIPHLLPNTILTDVGSVKEPIMEAIAPHWRNFVGGHPMAGTTLQGPESAQAGLFQGKPYVLTPTESTPSEAITTVEALVRQLQAKIYYCRAPEHDQAVAWISHLPVMISASLIMACLQEQDQTVFELAQQFASSGFRDTSRVGGGNPELGLMMAQYNRQALLKGLYQYRQTLDQITGWVEGENWQALADLLQATQQARPDFVDPV